MSLQADGPDIRYEETLLTIQVFDIATTHFLILFRIITESQGHVMIVYRGNSANKLPEIRNDTRVETQYTKTKRKRS